MSERGTFIVDRGIFDDPDFAPEAFTQREAWLWLVSAAAFRAHRGRGQHGPIELRRGEFCFSLRFLGERWQWQKDRVARFLKVLENRDMIRDTARDSEKVYLIKNYNKFQFAVRGERDSGASQAPKNRDSNRDTLCDSLRMKSDNKINGLIPDEHNERDSDRDGSRDTTATRPRQREEREKTKEKTLGASRCDAPREPELPIDMAGKPEADPPPEKPKAASDPFDDFWRKWPQREGSNPKKPAADAFRRALAKGADPDAIIDGAKRLAAKHAGERTPFIPQAVTWLNQRRWEDDTGPPLAAAPAAVVAPGPVSDDQWRQRLQWARENDAWHRDRWGPMPGEPESLVPDRLLNEAHRRTFARLNGAADLQRKTG